MLGVDKSVQCDGTVKSQGNTEQKHLFRPQKVRTPPRERKGTSRIPGRKQQCLQGPESNVCLQEPIVHNSPRWKVGVGSLKIILGSM